MASPTKQILDCQRCIETEANKQLAALRKRIKFLRSEMLIVSDGPFQGMLDVTMRELEKLLNITDAEVNKSTLALTQEIAILSTRSAELAAKKARGVSIIEGKRVFTGKTLSSVKKEMKRLKGERRSNIFIMRAVIGFSGEGFRNGLLGKVVNHFSSKARTEPKKAIEIGKDDRRKALERNDGKLTTQEKKDYRTEEYYRIYIAGYDVENEKDKKRFLNPQVIGYLWVSVLDSRTSSMCQDLSGKKFYYNRSGTRILPGFHPHCRSSTVDIIKDVPPPTFETFAQWSKQPENQDELEEAMGPTKYKLFTDGRLDISRFNSAHYQPLSLDTLIKQNEIAVERAGLDEENEG